MRTEMKLSRTGKTASFFKLTGSMLVLLAAMACNRAVGPPPPLPAAQIPVEMRQAFAQAGSDVKELIEEIERALNSKDYTAAYQRMQLISNLPEATKEQRLVSARAVLTLTQLLQAAQAQGDQGAGDALRQQQRTR